MGAENLEKGIDLGMLDGVEGVSEKDITIVNDTLTKLNGSNKVKFFQDIENGFKNLDKQGKKDVKKVFEMYFEKHKNSEQLLKNAYSILKALISEDGGTVEDKKKKKEIEKQEHNKKVETFNQKISKTASNFGLTDNELKNFLEFFNNQENILNVLNRYLKTINDFKENKIKEQTLDNFKSLLKNRGLSKGDKKNFFTFTHSADKLLADIKKVNEKKSLEKFREKEKIEKQELIKLGEYFGLNSEKTAEYDKKLKSINLSLKTFLTDYKNFIEKEITSGISNFKPNGEKLIGKIKEYIGLKLGGISEGINYVKNRKSYKKSLTSLRWDINEEIKKNFNFIKNELFPSLQLLIKDQKGKLYISQREQYLYDVKGKIAKTRKMLFEIGKVNTSDSKLIDTFESYKGDLFDKTKREKSIFDLFDKEKLGAKDYIKRQHIKPLKGVEFLSEEDKKIEADALIAIFKELPILMIPYYGDVEGLKSDGRDIIGVLDGITEKLKAEGKISPKYNKLNSSIDTIMGLAGFALSIATLVPLVSGPAEFGKKLMKLPLLGKVLKRLSELGVNPNKLEEVITESGKIENVSKVAKNGEKVTKEIDLNSLGKSFEKKFNKTLNNEQLNEIKNIKNLIKTADGLKGYNWERLTDLGFSKKEIVFIINSGVLGESKTIKAIKNMIHSKNKIGTELEKLYQTGITDIKQLESVFKNFNLNKIYNRENGMSYSDFDKLSVEEKILSLSTPKSEGLADGLKFSNGGDCNNWSLLLNDVLNKLKVKHSIVSLPGAEHSFIVGEIKGKHFVIDLLTTGIYQDKNGDFKLLNGYREITLGDHVQGGEIVSFNPLKVDNNGKITEFESFTDVKKFIDRTEKINYGKITIQYKDKILYIDDLEFGIPGFHTKYWKYKDEINNLIEQKGENVEVIDIIKIILKNNNKLELLEDKNIQELIKRIDKEAFFRILKGKDNNKKELNIIKKTGLSDKDRIKEANKLLPGKNIEKGSEEERLILEAHNIGEEETREAGTKFSELYAEKLELEAKGQKLSPEKEHRLKFIRGKKIKKLTDSGKFTEEEAIKLADELIIGKMPIMNKKLNIKLSEKTSEFLAHFTNSELEEINNQKLNYLNKLYNSGFEDYFDTVDEIKKVNEIQIENAIKLLKSGLDIYYDNLEDLKNLTEFDIKAIILFKKADLIYDIEEYIEKYNNHSGGFRNILKIIESIENIKTNKIKQNIEIISKNKRNPLKNKKNKITNNTLKEIDFTDKKSFEEYSLFKKEINKRLKKIEKKGLHNIQDIEKLFKSFSMSRIFKSNGHSMGLKNYKNLSLEEKISKMHYPNRINKTSKIPKNMVEGGNCHNYSLIYSELLSKNNIEHKIYSYGKGHSFIIGEINGNYFLIDGYNKYYSEIKVGQKINHGYGENLITSVDPLKFDEKNIQLVKNSLIESYGGKNKIDNFIKSRSKYIKNKFSLSDKNNHLKVEKFFEENDEFLEFTIDRDNFFNIDLGKIFLLKEYLYKNIDFLSIYEFLDIIIQNEEKLKKLPLALLKRIDKKYLLDMIFE